MITSREMQNILDQVNNIIARLEKRIEALENKSEPTKRRKSSGEGDGETLRSSS